jgi:hypothetical protein
VSREAHSIIYNTGDIIFMGTLYYRSGLASWGSFLSTFCGNFRATNREIVSTLEQGATDLQRIGEEFQQMLLRSDFNMQIMCLYKELRMPVVGKVVKSELAVLRGYESCSINANHKDMMIFAGDADTGLCSFGSR